MVLNNKKYKCVGRRRFDFTSEDVGYEWKISRMSADGQQDLKVSGDIGLQGCNYDWENKGCWMLSRV